MEIFFLINLKKDTSSQEFIRAIEPKGWLTAPENANDSLRKQLSENRNSKLLFADNGNFSLIGKAAKNLNEMAEKVEDNVNKFEDILGRTAKRTELPEEIKKQATEVAMLAIEEAEKLQQIKNEENPLGKQLELLPSHIIGVEDITPAVFLRLGLKYEWLLFDRSFYLRRNRAVASAAKKIRRTLNKEIVYYPVASAMDYNTAYDAGRIFAAKGHKQVAMGMGAFMADNSYVDGYRVGRRWVRLGRNVPNRYLSTALVTRGFFDGYRKEAGISPEAFHFLGVGAPIIMPIAARAAWGATQITFDATSPIKDAAERTIYVNIPAYLKIRTWKVAQRFARNPQEIWDCPCPFCNEFIDNYPFDYEGLRKSVLNTDLNVEPEDLSDGGRCFHYAPLLSEPNGGELRKAVSYARMGHNHWVVVGICNQLNDAAKNEAEFDQLIDSIVEDYTKNSGGIVFSEAVQRALKISRGDFY